MARIAGLVAPLLVLAAVARALPAQASLTPPPYAEYRGDFIDGRHPSAQAGVGITVPVGIYVRVAATGAFGAEWRDGDTQPIGRTDVIARFLLDPFRQTPVALSMGGGVTVPYERGSRVRPLLTAVIDVEGRRHGAVTPALQIGLGGGLRVGIALRTSVARRR